MSPEARSRLLTWVMFVFFGGLLGYAYAEIAYGNTPGEGTSFPWWMSAGIGASISGMVSFFEIWFVSYPGSKIRQMAFIPLFLIRLIIVTIMIFGSILTFQYLSDTFAGTNILETALSSETNYLSDYGFSILISSMVIFYLQMRLFIGSRNLTNLIFGKYHLPSEERCIFMICDVVDSSATALKIGDLAFHEYLGDLFVRCDTSITRNGGMVHSYVGDAMIVVWPLTDDPKKNAQPLTAAFSIFKLLKERAHEIEMRHGVAAEVRIAMHGGPVIVGETGFSKRQITYLGDTLNMTARIEAKTKELNQRLLISSFLLDQIKLPADVIVEDIGKTQLKGATQPLHLLSLKRSSEEAVA